MISNNTTQSLPKLQTGNENFLYRNKYTRLKDMLMVSNCLKVRELIEEQILRFIHKIKLGLTSEYFTGKLISFSGVHDDDTENN